MTSVIPKPIKQTVVEWLNTVDYSIDPNYVPSTFALEFVSFIKLVNGTEGEENLTPVVHYKMLDNVAGKRSKTINLCHRGMAKTTVLGEYLFLYIACYGELPEFGRVPLALYVSDSMENGVKNMRKNLEYRWENSDFLRQYVPKVRFTDSRWEFTNIEGKTLVVKGYGAKTGVRGAKEMGTRPVLAVLDDLLSDEDAKSPTIVENVEATIYKAVEHALLPSRKKVIWSGTPFNAKDPLYKAVESGGWWVNVYPVCEQFPVDEADFRGSWPDRFTYEFVKEQYEFAMANGRPDTFNQELMLRIMSDEARLILDEDIVWYNRDDIIRNRDAYNYYITTDFATSEKTSADYSVISVWAYDEKGAWYWVDGVCERMTMEKNFDHLFRLAQKWNPQEVGIEVSGQQGGFVSLLQREMADRRVYFNLTSENNNGKPGVRPVTNKIVRFNTVVPMFKTGQIRFPKQLRDTPIMRECMEELSLVARDGFKSKHDDFADTISMLSVVNAWRPSGQGQPMVQDADTKLWGLDDEEEDWGADPYVV
ncbi:terminase large subunit [Vibrio phage D518]